MDDQLEDYMKKKEVLLEEDEGQKETRETVDIIDQISKEEIQDI